MAASQLTNQASVLKRPTSFNFANDVVDKWAAQDPSMRAMSWVSQDQSVQYELSYGYFSRRSHRIATLLRSLGAQVGDRMLVIMPRLPIWWELGTAAIRSGVVLCPATTLLVDKDIEYRCRVAKIKIFVGDSVAVQKFLNIRSSVPHVKTVLQVDGATPAGVIPLYGTLGDVPEDAVFPRLNNKPEDPAIIYFTSGTTGMPKMVQHSHISYPLASTLTGQHWLRLKPGKLFWNLSEQGWAKAAWGFFGPWLQGAAIFIFDDRKAFSAITILELLHKHPITTFCAPPTAYRQLILKESLDYLQKHPLKALEHCVGAGEPLNDEVIKVWKAATQISICDGYGQTETICICGNFEGKPIKPGSMGLPTPGVPLAVIDDSGNEAKVGEEGDIAVLLGDATQSDTFFGLFDGYLGEDGRPVRRMKTFPGLNGERSWYITGDRASRDSDGYFWFKARADDVITSSAYRIGPFEVESTLKQHPGVVESAVVGSPDESRGEIVKAFIVLTREYADKDPEQLISELQEFCKKNAAPYKYPRKIEFVSPEFLPKTISGKIKRADLRKMEFAKHTPNAKL